MTGMESYSILLIEDDSVQAELVSRYLAPRNSNAHGMTFEITWAAYLRDGVEQLARNDLDLILLDLRLPDCWGLESIQRLLAEDPDASIIMMTNLADTAVAMQAAQEGAHDYLEKGDLTPEHLIRSLRYAVESKHRRLAQRKLDATEREMEAAGAVQRMLLPKSAPIIPGLDIAGGYWPFNQVGGDYFDYFSRDGHLSLVMADVSGHGLSSALLMAGLRRLLRSCIELHDDIGQILTIANRGVYEDTEGTRFVTAFLGNVDIETRELTYVSAGHPSYIVARSGNVTTLDGENAPLGIIHDKVITIGSPVILQASDVLVLLTDGVYEARNGNGELWGIDAIVQTIREHHQETAAEIIAACHRAVHAHCDGRPVSDDMALVVVKVSPR